VAFPARAVPANASGDLFVDDRCIACDTCRQLAPATFGGDEDGQAHVARQPADPGERRRALHALVSCPVAAIGSRSKQGVAAAAAELPLEVAPGVFRCGWAAASSYGASAWLLVRPGGNVLVDSPRWAGPLLGRLRALGGVRWLFLTHRDDVADHRRWHEALGCERILHAADVTGGTRGVERRLEGTEPTRLAEDLVALPVPGHTPGSAALLAGEEHLFTGDHLWAGSDGRLDASAAVCWWDWDEQARSMARLAGARFRRVWPGHGRPWDAPSVGAAQAAVRALAARMARAGG
jgi:glyoxylase-like metal-dependent hydrolase (beta-lactamase superfamily II)/ferredoxin